MRNANPMHIDKILRYYGAFVFSNKRSANLATFVKTS